MFGPRQLLIPALALALVLPLRADGPAPSPEPILGFSTEGAAANSPMYSMPHGGGSIGVGAGVFGQQYGAYTSLIIQRIAEKWQTANLDPRSQRTQAIVNFDIRRDGSVSNARISQRSGNASLDASAQRAILDAAPFPALPPQFSRNEAEVELRFSLK